MKNPLLDLLFPPVSLDGTDGAWVTDAERASMAAEPWVLSESDCAARGIPSVHHVAAAALYDASPLLRTAVQRFKYRRVRGVERALGAMLCEAASRLNFSEGAVLCPVPLHWSRQFARGFNQSEVLARYVAAAHGVRVEHLLRRNRATGKQSRRTRHQRLHALEGAFAVTHAVLPARVVLVDDVCTTGATLEACAKTLRIAGVKTVEAVVLALG